MSDGDHAQNLSGADESRLQPNLPRRTGNFRGRDPCPALVREVTMFLLADVNSMYCACEQVFRSDLKGVQWPYFRTMTASWW